MENMTALPMTIVTGASHGATNTLKTVLNYRQNAHILLIEVVRLKGDLIVCSKEKPFGG